jgi:hypothetical protein
VGAREDALAIQEELKDALPVVEAAKPREAT